MAGVTAESGWGGVFRFTIIWERFIVIIWGKWSGSIRIIRERFEPKVG